MRRKPKMKKPADCSAPVVKLAVDNPIISHEEMAAMDFKPVPTLAEFATDLQKHEGTKRSCGRSLSFPAWPDARFHKPRLK
jgi:hypothetical protein